MNKVINRVIIASTETYLLNYLFKEKFISEQEHNEIKKYIGIDLKH